MKKGFTLIELLMVVAIIAIISTLAVSKIGGVKESSARKISLANQAAVERGISAFLVSGGRLNRLDSLIYAGEGGAPLFGMKEGDFDFDTVSTAQGREGLYLGPSAEGSSTDIIREEQNSGLTPGLNKVLCLYTLSKKQAEALNSRLGLKYVMAHTAYADVDQMTYPSLHYPKDRAPYGDGTVPNAANGLDANASAMVATIVTNGMIVAAINPRNDIGRTIYQAMGQELLSTENYDYQGNRNNAAYDENEVRSEIASKGGPLIAFGLGDNCSVIGKANAGLESAPYASYAQKRFYSRYIVLIRLRTVGEGSIAQVIPEFAGVLDCCGNTIRAAQSIVRSM